LQLPTLSSCSSINKNILLVLCTYNNNYNEVIYKFAVNNKKALMIKNGTSEIC